MTGDFHIHSQFSDGSYSLAEIISHARDKNIKALSLTDHDTVSGLEEFLQLSKAHGLVAVAGVELSSVFENEDVHILGYGIDFHNKTLLERLNFFQQKRKERLKKIIECLQESGLKVSYEDFKGLEKSSESPGRSHIASVLVKKGYCQSVSEAFKLWLGRGSRCFQEKYLISPFEQIELVNEASGIAVLAHPGDYKIELPLKELVKAGLKGIEVFHPDHGPGEVEKYLAIASEYGLLITGGSDAHGPQSDRGYLIGDAVLPEEYTLMFLKELGVI